MADLHEYCACGGPLDECGYMCEARHRQQQQAAVRVAPAPVPASEPASEPVPAVVAEAIVFAAAPAPKARAERKMDAGEQMRWEAFQRREDHVAALRELRLQRARARVDAASAAAEPEPEPEPAPLPAESVRAVPVQVPAVPRPSSRIVVLNKRVQLRRDRAAARKAAE